MEKTTKYELNLKKKAIERGRHEGLEKELLKKGPGYHLANNLEEFCA
jgi:hypothetical protein